MAKGKQPTVKAFILVKTPNGVEGMEVSGRVSRTKKEIFNGVEYESTGTVDIKGDLVRVLSEAQLTKMMEGIEWTS